MISKQIFFEDNPKEKLKDINDEIDFRQSTADALRNVEDESEKYSWQDFREYINIFCNVSLRMFYICCSVLQFFAIFAGVGHLLPSHDVISVIISLPLGFLPVIGTALGIWGAHSAWNWYLSHSVIIFTAPYLMVFGPMYMISVIEFYKDLSRWQSEKSVLKNQ